MINVETNVEKIGWEGVKGGLGMDRNFKECWLRRSCWSEELKGKYTVQAIRGKRKPARGTSGAKGLQTEACLKQNGVTGWLRAARGVREVVSVILCRTLAAIVRNFDSALRCNIIWRVLSRGMIWSDLLFHFYFYFIYLFFGLFVFLGPHPWHMEVPKLEVHSKLSLPTYTTAHSNAGSLTHWARPGIEPTSSWMLVGFVNCWATVGTPWLTFLNDCLGCCVETSLGIQGQSFERERPLRGHCKNPR